MTRRWIVLALLVPALAGCIGAVNPDVGPGSVAGPVQVVDAASTEPVPRARVAAYQVHLGDPGYHELLAILSADAEGRLDPTELPAETDEIRVTADGYAPTTVPLDGLPSTIRLEQGMSNGAPVSDVLGFLDPVELTCPDVDPPPYSCGRFGEPVVEVAGDGRIWASATCCIGRAPPIWTSTDGGESFDLVTPTGNGPTEAVRQTYGIEGDFAIDTAGNVYFFDIALGASWFTSYDADAQHRHTVAHPFPPLVDRPWVRAAGEDEVFIAYNTGSQTRFYPSTDGGVTFDTAAGHTFDCPLGTFGQGPTKADLLLASACPGPDGGASPQLWMSDDAGATWSDPETIPLPDEHTGQGIDLVTPPVADAAGNVYVPYNHTAGPDGAQSAIHVVRRAPDGTWAGPWEITPPGRNVLPWIAAGQEGRIAVAYYHADEPHDEPGGEWRLHVSASVDADGSEPSFQTVQADDTVLHEGTWDRSLGDFLQIDIMPDGRLAIVYGQNTHDGGVDGQSMNVRNRFVASAGGLDLAPLDEVDFLNGP